MRFNRWVWAVGLLLLAHTLAAFIPSIPNLSLPRPAETKAKPNQSEPTSANVCQTARTSVLTLYIDSDFGSGTIVSSEGLVLTNHHVVKAASDGQVRARSWGGQLYQGQVVATDRVNDLALVQLNTKERLPAIRLAKPEAIQIGQKVCAIGSPYGRAGVITRGTLKSTLENGDLQSSILLHPGNSGGPLLNSQGDMIGINKAIWLSDSGKNVGIGFATTTTIAQGFIEQNRQKAAAIAARPSAPAMPSAQTETDQQTTPPEAPANFGLPPATPSDVRLGAMVDSQSLVIQLVEPDSPAERAGLSAGDRLVAVDSQRLDRVEDLQIFLQRRPSSAVFTISRNQRQQDVRVGF
ncbi:MAG: trypsin-like peptidase domain-containing protein [Tildeniella nuda ZEHNDER 1965/U140]|jgi:serine protease Do|nr:trypsin-like peptidase domain-containing protein [Tildeniella nuda ZEHNDER 1965/U140]